MASLTPTFCLDSLNESLYCALTSLRDLAIDNLISSLVPGVIRLPYWDWALAFTAPPAVLLLTLALPCYPTVAVELFFFHSRFYLGMNPPLIEPAGLADDAFSVELSPPSLEGFSLPPLPPGGLEVALQNASLCV